jgi:hypothetical protein
LIIIFFSNIIFSQIKKSLYEKFISKIIFMSFQKTIIYLALLLDIIGISVMIPAFPELKAYYGISDFAVTM